MRGTSSVKVKWLEEKMISGYNYQFRIFGVN